MLIKKSSDSLLVLPEFHYHTTFAPLSQASPVDFRLGPWWTLEQEAVIDQN